MIPSKAQYYNEDYSTMDLEQKFELVYMESREATGILLSAAQHVALTDHAAFVLLYTLRDELIESEIQFGENSLTARYRTMFNLRRFSVGIPTFVPKTN